MAICVQENVPLGDLTTFRIGGTARYFVAVSSVAELAEAVLCARQKKLPLVVLGGGSNTLIANGKIDALVVKIEIKGVEWKSDSPLKKGAPEHARWRDVTTPASEDLGTPFIKGESQESDSVFVIAGAGESWDALVAKSVKRGLWGFENLSGIPGTVGAAPIQNIGAYGAEVKDMLQWVEVFDSNTNPPLRRVADEATTQGTKVRTETVRKLSNADCHFGYRDSIFKKPEGKDLIVTRVAFRLTRNGVPNLLYKDLENYFAANLSQSLEGENKRGGAHPASILPSSAKGACRPSGGDPSFGGKEGRKETPTLLAIRRAVLEIRAKKFPDLKKFGTAGSFFKNPIIPKTQFDELKKKFPNLPGFLMSNVNGQMLPVLVKVSLAWILDNICHLKGYQNGNVALFENQPIVLVNLGGASAEEIRKFSKEVIQRVKEKTGIEIELEVQKIQ